MNQKLHSENFEICIMCLRNPEENRNINFVDIYKTLYEGKTLKKYLKKLFDITVHT